MTHTFSQFQTKTLSVDGEQGLASQPISTGEHEYFLPFQAEKLQQYIQDGILYTGRSTERTLPRRVVQTVPHTEYTMHSNLETYPQCVPQVVPGQQNIIPWDL